MPIEGIMCQSAWLLDQIQSVMNTFHAVGEYQSISLRDGTIADIVWGTVIMACCESSVNQSIRWISNISEQDETVQSIVKSMLVAMAHKDIWEAEGKAIIKELIVKCKSV